MYNSNWDVLIGELPKQPIIRETPGNPEEYISTTFVIIIHSQSSNIFINLVSHATPIPSEMVTIK